MSCDVAAQQLAESRGLIELFFCGVRKERLPLAKRSNAFVLVHISFSLNLLHHFHHRHAARRQRDGASKAFLLVGHRGQRACAG